MKTSRLCVIAALVIIPSSLLLQPAHNTDLKTANISRPERSATNRYSLEDISFTKYTGNGSYKQFTINGKSMGFLPKRAGIFLILPNKALTVKDVEVIFYSKNAPCATLMAKKAVFDVPVDDKSNMIKALDRPVEFTGDIRVITEDRRTLTCNTLIWDCKSGQFYASDRPVLTYIGKVIKGDSIQADILLKDFSSKSESRRGFKTTRRII